MAHRRNLDDKVITAGLGTAYAADESLGETPIPLPAAQQIAAGGTGLDFAKFRRAKRVLDLAEAPPEDRWAIIGPAQEDDLLNISQVTNTDYMARPVLEDGKVTRWLGFKIDTSNLLPTDGSGNRLCLFYQKSAIGLSVPMDVKTDAAPDPAHSFDIAMKAEMSLNATRIFETGVVQVACVES